MKCSDGMDTSEVLNETRSFVERREIEDVIVASTTGETGVKASEVFGDLDVNIAVVGHCTGFDEENEQEMRDANIEKIKECGGQVLIAPMIFHDINGPIRESSGSSPRDLVADVLRLFGQGTKVALECVLMACDAGLIDSGKDVVGIAGTGDGADTGLLIKSANTMNLFDSRIREVILKPSEMENLPYY